MNVEYIDRCSPLIIIKVSGETSKETEKQDINKIIVAIRRAAKMKDHYTMWIVETVPPATVRAAIGEEIKRLKKLNGFRFCIRNAMVFTSNLVRGIFVAIDWVSGGYGAETKTFHLNDIEKAYEWLEEPYGKQFRRAA